MNPQGNESASKKKPPSKARFFPHGERVSAVRMFMIGGKSIREVARAKRLQERTIEQLIRETAMPNAEGLYYLPGRIDRPQMGA